MLAFATYFIIIGAVVYCSFILCALISWHRISEHKPSQVGDVAFDVIIPAKDESTSIGPCLKSVRQSIGSKSNGRIIVVDDQSTDNTAEVAQQYLSERDLLLSNQTKSGKKNAVQLALKNTQQSLILATDGDCIVSKHWASLLSNALAANKNEMILGPVFIFEPKNLISFFQQFDAMATMAISQIGFEHSLFYSGSAANMGYQRDTFDALNPYEGNQDIASGDDIFFIEAIIKGGYKIKFIKHPEHFVRTYPESSWNKLFKQRMRWAGKTQHYSQRQLKIFWITMAILLTNFVVSICLLPFGINPVVAISIWLAKGLVDALLVSSVARYYDLKISFAHFIPSLLIYPFFILVVGITSLFQNNKSW